MGAIFNTYRYYFDIYIMDNLQMRTIPVTRLPKSSGWRDQATRAIRAFGRFRPTSGSSL